MENQKLLPLFGSQLIDSGSKTPYSDATQVKLIFFYFIPSYYVLKYIEISSTLHRRRRRRRRSPSCPQ